MYKYNQNNCNCQPAPPAIRSLFHEAVIYSNQFDEKGASRMMLTTDQL